MSNKMALDALTAALDAMEHMANTLNNMDAVDEDEDAQHDAAFEAVRAAIAALQAEPQPEHERNAARYVWLREHLCLTILRVLTPQATGLYCDTYAQQLDGVIDAEIDALPATPPKD